MPDFAIDYSALHQARKDLHTLADQVGPKLAGTAFSQVGDQNSYFDTDLEPPDAVFGHAGLAQAFRMFHGMAEKPMKRAERDIRDLGDLFGSVADSYFDVDAQIASGMGMMGSSLGLSQWKDRKRAWDHRQKNADQCKPGKNGKLPDFCAATDPGPPPTDHKVTTKNGSVHTRLTLDKDNNVVKEETTVVNGDQKFTTSTTYEPGGVTKTDTAFGDGSKTSSVTTTGANGSSTTDTTDQAGKKSKTVITLNDQGGGTMVTTDAEGKGTTHTRTDRYKSWVKTKDPEDDYLPFTPAV